MPHVLQHHIGVAIEGFDAGQDLAIVAAVDQHLDMSRFIGISECHHISMSHHDSSWHVDELPILTFYKMVFFALMLI